MTGLIIGSMTPDFEYFLRMKILSIYSHTLAGLFYFCLPMGLLTAFIFHNIIKKPLVANLPEFLNARLNAISKTDWNKHFKLNSLIVLSSILLGAISHLAWDACTHHNGFVVNNSAYLSSEFQLLNLKVKGYKILQHLSTIVGGLIIVLTIFKLPKTSTNQVIAMEYWFILGSIMTLIIGLKFLTGLSFNLQGLGTFVATSIAALFISLTLTPLILDLKNKRVY